MRVLIGRSSAIACAAVLFATAQAQYEYVSLQPAGWASTGVAAAALGVQVGSHHSSHDGWSRAVAWFGSASSHVDLHHPSWFSSSIADTDHGRFVGWVREKSHTGPRYAALWNGLSNEIVNLHPDTGFHHSLATGIAGDQQVGFAVVGMNPPGQVFEAYLWNGTAASAVSLHPKGATMSSAAKTDGARQVGWARFGGFDRALMWFGSSENWIDLTPAGAISARSHGVGEVQQVGVANIGGATNAALWSGSATSFVSLHPKGFSYSAAAGTNDNQQVGSVYDGVRQTAAVWSGNAESYLDLHQFLPSWAQESGWDSYATGIDEFGNVVGNVSNLIWERTHAVMWVVPEPGTVAALGLGLALLAARRRRLKV